ncbi:NADH-quinone oxidoreductase subunit NuoE [Gammaproteobacteria bacterium]|jgi:NADH-quinone oxidoreductase subunit E|nr:NADH-quinone oxidoreductase subunit NuoE [Gammaproteobacteria bacterium]MDB2444554.1 NADH-quinone oxidoreductase subunit NuoE [Gammaproteobacteria bacterium]MDG1952057.1 NADH-quinone oxidoreductase subunit NuoE [Gammaproteobacteria bacterium]MDG2119459.1 NADH-quinone oxidoreductase subunit NuoE [Gammaproteobacteria bacterium]|tara:strand:+ start:3382 stop:3909 length:528 start_codon:yes stop_codon:yes gene_type:complete
MNREVIVSSGKIARELSEAEVKEIEHELTLYPDKKAVGLEALKIVQRHNGWVSDESMLAISKYLDIALSELEGVATFFNLIYRRPVGKNVILFCDSVSCWIMGCEKIRKEINDHLGIDYGETTEDGEYTLIPVPCLGDCDKAPVMLVGEKMHRNLTADSIKSLSSSGKAQNKSGE